MLVIPRRCVLNYPSQLNTRQTSSCLHASIVHATIHMLTGQPCDFACQPRSMSVMEVRRRYSHTMCVYSSCPVSVLSSEGRVQQMASSFVLIYHNSSGNKVKNRYMPYSPMLACLSKIGRVVDNFGEVIRRLSNQPCGWPQGTTGIGYVLGLHACLRRGCVTSWNARDKALHVPKIHLAECATCREIKPTGTP